MVVKFIRHLRETFKDSLMNRKKNRIFTVFVLLIESGTVYVIMLIADLLVTSLVTGGPESVGRMVSCISGYSSVQFVVCVLYPSQVI